MRLLRQVANLDKRLVSSLMRLDIDLHEKIKLVESMLVQQSDNPDLLYVSSYLHAQAGDVDDTMKFLEQAIQAK